MQAHGEIDDCEDDATATTATPLHGRPQCGMGDFPPRTTCLILLKVNNWGLLSRTSP